MDALTGFATILLESGAWLLLGALTSGLIDAFARPADLARWLPRRAIPAALVGSLLGMALPAASLGNLLVVRRLLQKGVSPVLSMAYLLGGPLLNLVALAGLVAALGDDRSALIVYAAASTFALAVTGGLVFASTPPLLRHTPSSDLSEDGNRLPLGAGLHHARQVMICEGLELGGWLLVGAGLAAGLSLVFRPADLAARAGGPAESVFAALALGFLRGTGPLADAFAARDWVDLFGGGAVVGGVLLGAAANLTRVIGLLVLFRRRAVLVLVALAGLGAALVGVTLALNVVL